MKKGILFPIISLLIICVVMSGAVSVTNYFTADAIARQDELKISKNIESLLPQTENYNLVQLDKFSYYECSGADGEGIGRVYLVDTKGYGGKLSIMVGIKTDLTTAGIAILSSSETPGLGKKSESEGFLSQFRDKLVSAFTVTKAGAESVDEINAISGATITTKAVVAAVNTVLEHYSGEVSGND